MGFPGTDTLESLIYEVQHNLLGFGQATDAMAALDVGVGVSDLSIKVNDAASFSRGIAEIGDELIFIKDVDVQSGTLVLQPFGRGFRGTGAQAHDAGEIVTMAPVWPRSSVAREINNVIRSLYPNLFAVRVDEFDYSVTQFAYELPATTEMVLEVRHRHPGSTRDWETSRHWDVRFSADSTDFPSGVAVEVYTGHITPGARVQVVYATRPTALTDLSDEFAETTGLPESAKDLILLGVAARLAPYMDASRIPVQSVEADELDAPRQMGTAVQVGREFQRSFEARLAEEKRALYNRYPARYRRTR